MGHERRRSPRITPPAGEVRVLVHDAWHRAALLDMSSTGARFGGDLPSLGARVRLQLRVPCHLLRVSGSVVRQGDDAAVQFDPLTQHETLALNAALLEAEPPTGIRRGAVILMVDDPAQQLALGRALRAQGFEVISRTTPLDVMQRLVEDTTAAPIRAAIVSRTLPNRAGDDILEFLAAEKPSIILASPDDVAALGSVVDELRT